MPYDFAKLTTDVKDALLAGHVAAAATDDGGTCNLDGVLLKIPRVQEKLIVEALAAAGVRSNKGEWGLWGTGYMINPTSGGQANMRYKACQAIHEHLFNLGYDARRFYMVD